MGITGGDGERNSNGRIGCSVLAHHFYRDHEEEG